MKTLLALIAFSSAMAQADVSSQVYRTSATLTDIQLDPQLQLKDIAIATVAVGTDSAVLTLYRRDSQGILQVVRSFRTAIKSVTNSCGSTLVTARDDGRPADGALIEMSVLDNRHRECKDRRQGETEVVLKTSVYDLWTGQEQKTSSFFAGPALQPNLEH